MMARLFLFLLLFCCLQTDDGNFCFHFAFFRVMFVYMSEKCGSLRINSHIVVVWNMCSIKETDRERAGEEHTVRKSTITTIIIIIIFVRFLLYNKNHSHINTERQTSGPTDRQTSSLMDNNNN